MYMLAYPYFTYPYARTKRLLLYTMVPIRVSSIGVLDLLKIFMLCARRLRTSLTIGVPSPTTLSLLAHAIARKLIEHKRNFDRCILRPGCFCKPKIACKTVQDGSGSLEDATNMLLRASKTAQEAFKTFPRAKNCSVSIYYMILYRNIPF